MEITETLANALIQYMANRPYAEVYQLIAGLQLAAKPGVLADKETIKVESKEEDTDGSD